MIPRLLAKLTYANVVSTLAVFLLLGGVSYAAATLAANSVGSRELKNNAVRSAEVKDGSLQATDFAAGQLPAGPQGPQGPAGPAGPRGPAGAPPALDPRDLLDPAHDLPGGFVSISVDGIPVANGVAYRVACSSAARCSLQFAKGVDSNIELHAWFEAAQAGEPNAKRDFSVVVFNNVGAPVLRYFVTNGLPTSYVENGRRIAVGFDADRIQRVSV